VAAITGAEVVSEAALRWLATHPEPSGREARPTVRTDLLEDIDDDPGARFVRRCREHHLALLGLRCPATRYRVETSFEVFDAVTGLVAAEASAADLECRWIGPYAAVFDGDARLSGRDQEGAPASALGRDLADDRRRGGDPRWTPGR